MVNSNSWYGLNAYYVPATAWGLLHIFYLILCNLGYINIYLGGEDNKAQTASNHRAIIP